MSKPTSIKFSMVAHTHAVQICNKIDEFETDKLEEGLGLITQANIAFKDCLTACDNSMAAEVTISKNKLVKDLIERHPEQLGRIYTLSLTEAKGTIRPDLGKSRIPEYN